MRGDSLSLESFRTVRQWDVHSAQCLKSVLAHDSYIYRLAGGTHTVVCMHTQMHYSHLCFLNQLGDVSWCGRGCMGDLWRRQHSQIVGR